MAIVSIKEPEPFEVLKHPYPYQAAFTIASDIDSGSVLRFRAVHELFCSSNVVRKDSPEWEALGLSANSPGFDHERIGVPGFGFNFADSFFLIGDPTTFGMYRYLAAEDRFVEDQQDGINCAQLIRQWIQQGQIDSFHAFLHYTRAQLEPLLKHFYDWCEREYVSKPSVWINHSTAVTPSGLCPDGLQPHVLRRLARLAVRKIAGPFLGRRRYPLRHAFVRYRGATPGSRYYVNDLLAANGLRYVYVNIADIHCNKVALPERQQNGRATILEPIAMDDGVRYWRFERCCGGPSVTRDKLPCLRDSPKSFDSSVLISEKNLEELCRVQGTCILSTHWTHSRSTPLADQVLARFRLLRQWQEAGRIWLTSTARLLEWTRRRTFLRCNCRRESRRLVVDIDGVHDPLFGREKLQVSDVDGLCFRLQPSDAQVTIALKGQLLTPDQVRRAGQLYWLDTGNYSGSRKHRVAPGTCLDLADANEDGVNR